MRTAYVVTILAILLASLIPVASIAMAQQEPKTIVVGALLPLTGDLQSYGIRAKAALEVALEDINKYLEEKNAWFRLDLKIEDSQTKPDVAVQKFNALVAQGIKFIIGPMTSAEAKKLVDLANKNNVLLISPSSTAVELAIPGDNLFRFCPNDVVQSKVVVKLLQDLGIEAALLIIRADTWGLGLEKGIKEGLDKAGIKVLGALEYNPESPNFPSIAAQADSIVGSAIKEYGKSKVAVVLVAFSEAAELFKQAAGYSSLRSVLWTGSDGTAKLSEIVSDPVSAKFAADVLFINPLFSPAATAKQKEVAQRVKSMIGEEPDAYSYAAHDALWAIALALLKIGPVSDPNEMVNKVKELLPEITTSDEFGKVAATGKFPLAPSGDRATADYDMWMPMEMGGKVEWVKVGKYVAAKDDFDWYPVNGKTFPELFKERFAGAAATPSPAPTASPAPTPSPAPSEQPNYTLYYAIAGVIVVIVIVGLVVWLARRK